MTSKVIKLNMSFIIILTAILGCGGQKNNPTETEARPSTKSTETTVDVFSTRLQISCPSAEACSPSQALLVINEQDNLTRCVANLIDGQRVLTAGQCIPESISIGDSCESNIRIIFPGMNESEAEVVPCHKLESRSRISKSKNKESKKDFAILSLAKASSRKVSQLASSSISSGQEIKIQRFRNVSDDQSAPHLIGEVLNCKALKGSLMASLYKGANDPYIALSDCRLSTSDYGAAVKNAEDKQIALISHGLDPYQLMNESSESYKFIKYRLDMPTRKPVVTATTINCIEGVNSSTLPHECEQKIDMDQFYSESLSKYRKNLNFNPDLRSISPHFRWTFKSKYFESANVDLAPELRDDQTFVSVPQPICILAGALEDPAYQDFLGGMHSKLKLKSDRFPLFILDLNEYMQMIHEDVPLPVAAEIDFSPYDLLRNKKSEVIIKIKKLNGSSLQIFKAEVPLCTPQNFKTN